MPKASWKSRPARIGFAADGVGIKRRGMVLRQAHHQDPRFPFEKPDTRALLIPVTADTEWECPVSYLNAESNDVSVLRGNGDGTFLAEVFFGTGDEPRGIAAGDVNADGLPDIVTGNLNDDSMSTLLNRTNIVGGPLPEALIAAPIHLGCQCGLEEVLGVADVGSGMFDRWDLEYRATSVDVWTPLAESGTAVPFPGGLLTSWDTTLLAEGRYLLRLTVTSISGLTATDEVVVWISRDFDAASTGHWDATLPVD